MRIANRVLAMLFGLALLAAGVILIIEVVAYRADAAPVVFDWTATYRWAQRTTWDDTAVRVTAGVLALVGLALLASQLVPRRPSRLPLRSGDGATDMAITRRGLSDTLSDAVNNVDGVGATRVAVRRRRVKIKAQARAALASTRDTEVRDTVTSAAQHRLDELDLRRPPRVAVNLSRGGR
jgi:hypothetical protein